MQKLHLIQQFWHELRKIHKNVFYHFVYCIIIIIMSLTNIGLIKSKFFYVVYVWSKDTIVVFMLYIWSIDNCIVLSELRFCHKLRCFFLYLSTQCSRPWIMDGFCYRSTDLSLKYQFFYVCFTPSGCKGIRMS